MTRKADVVPPGFSFRLRLFTKKRGTSLYQIRLFRSPAQPRALGSETSLIVRRFDPRSQPLPRAFARYRPPYCFVSRMSWTLSSILPIKHPEKVPVISYHQQRHRREGTSTRRLWLRSSFWRLSLTRSQILFSLSSFLLIIFVISFGLCGRTDSPTTQNVVRSRSILGRCDPRDPGVGIRLDGTARPKRQPHQP